MPAMRPPHVAGAAQHGARPGASGSSARRARSNIVSQADSARHRPLGLTLVGVESVRRTIFPRATH
eukprot:2596463-Prymnesium_polylepis.1